MSGNEPDTGSTRAGKSTGVVLAKELGDAREGVEDLAKAVIAAHDRDAERRAKLTRDVVRAVAALATVALLIAATIAALAWGGKLSLAGFGLDVTVGDEAPPKAEFDAHNMQEE